MALGLLKTPPLQLEKQRTEKRPRVEVQASAPDAQPSEWASLLSDLARHPTKRSELDVDWRVHDKTHLEFAIDYPFVEEGQVSYTWEAFFFVPESFRLDGTTYDKKEMYEDLLSYVRLAVPEIPFSDLGLKTDHLGEKSLLSELEETILATVDKGDGSIESRLAIRRARTYACLVRASGLDAQRAMMTSLALESGEPADAQTARKSVGRYLKTAGEVARAYRVVLDHATAQPLPSEVEVALKWVDEDISLMLETLAATASVRIQEKATADPTMAELAGRLASEAVREARYRTDKDYPSVGRADASPREVEHIEFRRHMLKRFTSSVLWLKHEVRDGASWVLHGLYAVAAAVAMAFAVIATLRATQVQNYFYVYTLVLVVSYAVKDRLKAFLQAWFSRWAEKRFPNRMWTIRDPEREESVGLVRERAGFRPFAGLPESVLQTRRLTREHALEEFARPETVLWHEKSLILPGRGDRAHKSKLVSPMLTEIFRLNIGPWLSHTDDPNRTITFADPNESTVYSATARRVYNISVVYRLRSGESKNPWRRIRVVVSRKGIERIDPII